MSSRSTRKVKTLVVGATLGAVFLTGGLLSPQTSMALPPPDVVLRLSTTLPVDGDATGVAVDAGLGRLYVTTSNNSMLRVYDDDTLVLLDSITLIGEPRGVALDETTHTVYVATSIGVSVVDGTENPTIQTIEVGSGSSAVAVRSIGGLTPSHTVYLANADAHTVTAMDGATREFTASIAVGLGPSALAADQATGVVYVANADSATVSVIDGATNAVTATLGTSGTPRGVAVDSSTGRLYVSSSTDDVVNVFDVTTNEPVYTTSVNPGPRGIAIDEATHTAYVTNFGFDSLAVMNTDGTVTQSVGVDAGPVAVAVNPLTHRVFVANEAGNTISVFDPIIPDVVSTSMASAVVLAGPRTASLASLDLGSVPYSHADQSATGSTTLSVDDSSGSAAGWAVTAQVGAFVWSAPGGAATDAPDIAAANLAITAVGSVTTVAGQEWATDTVAVTGALNDPVLVLSAARDAGQGTYTMPVDMALTVPGTTHAGTYTATLTTTLSVAP